MAGASRCEDISYLTPTSSRQSRRMQAHGERPVADDESFRTDEERNLAGREVAHVCDEWAARDRGAVAGLWRCELRFHSGCDSWDERQGAREYDSDRAARQESPTGQILHIPSSKSDDFDTGYVVAEGEDHRAGSNEPAGPIVRLPEVRRL